MKPLLYIITPCSRPDKLPIMAVSIKPGRLLFDLTWLVILDGGEHPDSISGNAQRNDALDIISRGWVCFMDDDNLIHPSFFSGLLDAITRDSSARGFAYNQIMCNGQTRLLASHEAMHPCHVDIAQVCIQRELIGTIRFIPNIYEADGEFIEAVYQSDQEAWRFIDDALCYYNALR